MPDEGGETVQSPPKAVKGFRVTLNRVGWIVWTVVCALALACFSVVLTLYFQGPEAGLGPCAPTAVLTAFFGLATAGIPWIVAHHLRGTARGTSRGT